MDDASCSQTALAVSCVGKCAGENNRSTVDPIVLTKVAQGRSSGETARNADWSCSHSFSVVVPGFTGFFYVKVF